MRFVFKKLINFFMRASLTSVADARIDKGERDIGSDHTDENEKRNKHTVRKYEIDIFLQNRFIHKTPSKFALPVIYGLSVLRNA